jgi:hypothetical protein
MRAEEIAGRDKSISTIISLPGEDGDSFSDVTDIPVLKHLCHLATRLFHE